MKASNSMRIWFALMGVMLWIGIFLTGFSNVSWLLYLPAAGLISASIIGICPLEMGISKMFGNK
jgi:hypothetical protein